MRCEGYAQDWWVHPNQLMEAPQIPDPSKKKMRILFLTALELEEEEHFSQEVIQNEMMENFHERVEEEYALCVSQSVTILEMQKEVTQ
jgi:hypothetical protein